jgi:hypothetical protein
MCKAPWGMLYRRLTCEPNQSRQRCKPLTPLCRPVNRINSEVASKKEQKSWKKIFSATIDRDRIVAWEKDLDGTLQLFNVCVLNFT